MSGVPAIRDVPEISAEEIDRLFQIMPGEEATRTMTAWASAISTKSILPPRLSSGSPMTHSVRNGIIFFL